MIRSSFLLLWLTLAGCVVETTGPSIGPRGEGEGEGDIDPGGEGEGDVDPSGEGEGDVGPGEGEGDVDPGEGEGEGDVEPGEGEGDVGPGPDDVPNALAFLQTGLDTARSVDLVTSNVIQLTVRAGALTGTLDITDPNQPSYVPMPTDALVVREGLQTLRVVHTSFDGDLSRGIDEVLLRDHSLVYTAVNEGGFNLTVSDVQMNGAVTASASGFIVYEGVNQNFTLNATGTTTSSISGQSIDYTNAESRTGTLTGPINATFSETESYRAIASDNFVENFVTTFDIDGDTNGVSFSLSNGNFRRAFLNTRPAEPDFWSPSGGDLLRNDQPYASLAFRETASAFQFTLTAPNRTAILESYTR
jgi:hypothetical protein